MKKIYGRNSISLNTKIMLAAIILLLLYMFFMPNYIAAAEIQTAPDFSGYRTAFENTDVMDDLYGYNLSSYSGTNTISMIMFTEFGYQRKTMSAFGIYFYIYNDTGKPIIDYGRNMVQLSLDGEHYDKYRMQILDQTDDNTVYKIKVQDTSQSGVSLMQSIVGQNTRSYTISGMEWLTGNGLADYPVAHTFKYTGEATFKEGEESTLQCIVEDQDVVIITGLEDRQTVYLTDMDNQNMNRHNQVNSVYFGVDNAIIEKYGQLQQIEAEWWEYRTTPIIVTNNEELSSCLLTMREEIIDGHNCDYDWGLGVLEDETLTGSIENFLWTYNIYTFSSLNGNGIYSDEEESKLAWILRTSEWDENIDNYVVELSELEEYKKAYERESFAHFTTDNGYKYCTDLFNTDVGNGRKAGYNHTVFDAEDPEDMINFTEYDPSYSGWDLFKHIFGWEDTFDEVLKDQTPILTINSSNRSEYLSGSNEEIADRLLIDVNDVSKFKDYVSNSVSANQTVVLFRFACTEYYAAPLIARNYNEHTFHTAFDSDDISFIAEENVFLNFDIMTLGFYNGEKMSIIPVVSSPIDIISDVVGPKLPDLLPWGDPEWGLMDYIYFALMVVAAVLVFVVLYGILDMISNSVMRASSPTRNYSRRKRRR